MRKILMVFKCLRTLIRTKVHNVLTLSGDTHKQHKYSKSKTRVELKHIIIQGVPKKSDTIEIISLFLSRS